jgi:hypothetical protein
MVQNFKYFEQESVEIKIGRDLQFELLSLFGRFDKSQKVYVEIHRALIGMVMVHERYKTDEELDKTGREVSRYLKQYNPTYEQLLGIES